MVSPARARSAPALGALGIALARRGPLAIASIAIGVLTTFAMIVGAFVLAARGGRSLAQLPGVTASALAWGAGVMLAFAASTRALRRDKDDGVRALVRARGGSTPAYVGGRIAGLVVLVAIVVAGGTLIAGVASTALASSGNVARVAKGAGAAVVYALAFSATIAPVALAALGARSRIGGYFALVSVLVLPELFGRWTAQMLPRGWHELTSIPAVLGALRAALTPGTFDVATLLRASVVLAAIAAVATVIVRTQVARVDAEAS